MRSESVSGRWDKENNGPGFAGGQWLLVLAGAMGGPVRVRLRPSYPRRRCGEPESRLELDDELIFVRRSHLARLIASATRRSGAAGHRAARGAPRQFPREGRCDRPWPSTFKSRLRPVNVGHAQRPPVLLVRPERGGCCLEISRRMQWPEQGRQASTSGCCGAESSMPMRSSLSARPAPSAA